MADFAPLTVSNVKLQIPTDKSGNIDPDGLYSKYFTIAGISATCTLAESMKVFDAFIGDIANTTYDSLSAVRTITQGVT